MTLMHGANTSFNKLPPSGIFIFIYTYIFICVYI